MSLHDVVIHLLKHGLPKTETLTDELIAQVEDDRRPKVVETPEEAAARQAREEAIAAKRAELAALEQE